MRYLGLNLLLSCLLLSIMSGCGGSQNSGADPEFLDLRKQHQDKLESNPELQKKAEQRKRMQT